jgi:8-oxo-dGTP pyrophosphatase MutT (NUDIX family)
MTDCLEIVARGPWLPADVTSSWLDGPYTYDAPAQAAADRALAALEERDSPSHEGVSARLASHTVTPGRLDLALQRAPWSARLLDGDKHESLAAVCVLRDADGRWLAGRRAPWVAIWPGAWMLGGAGSIEAGEDVVETMRREVVEEWSVEPAGLAVEAIVRLPDGLLWLVAQAWLPRDAQPAANDEHADWAWWPASMADWPAGARPELVALGELLDGGLRR